MTQKLCETWACTAHDLGSKALLVIGIVIVLHYLGKTMKGF